MHYTAQNMGHNCTYMYMQYVCSTCTVHVCTLMLVWGGREVRSSALERGDNEVGCEGVRVKCGLVQERVNWRVELVVFTKVRWCTLDT